MRYTNKHNIPLAIYNALVRDDYVLKGDISATGLTKSVRQVQLAKRFDKLIVVDASTRLWSLLGRAVHNIVEQHGPDEYVMEETLKAEVLGWIVAGTPDVWIPSLRDLDDYKVTAVAALSKAKEEWVTQLNYYRWLIETQTGVLVNNMTIHAILRDHMIWNLFKDKNYPLIPFKSRPIEKLSLDKVEAMIYANVKRHQEGEGFDDAAIPNCTPAELWQDPDKWAVLKKGGKRAIPGGVCDTQDAAEDLVKLKESAGKASYTIDYRPSQAKRCHYCDPRCVCGQYKVMLKEGMIQKLPDGLN